MKAYRILVHDRREDGPVVLDAELGRDDRAIEVARQRLAGSPFISSVELWRGETLLCSLTRAQLQAA